MSISAMEVERWYQKATFWQTLRGMSWYRRAHKWALSLSSMHGLPVETVAGITAAISPATSWERNVIEVEHLLSGIKIKHTTYTPNVKKAQRILLGEHPMDVLGGKKVLNFYKLIANPRDTASVCIDRHAVRICTKVDFTSDSEAAAYSKKNYESCAEAFREVARNHAVLPWQVQATTWVAYREQPKEHRKWLRDQPEKSDLESR